MSLVEVREALLDSPDLARSSRAFYSGCPMRRAARPAAMILAALVAISAGGCGDDGGAQLTVLAASSLQEALTAYGTAFPADVRTSFAGSDQLASQIRQGVPADVYAAANTAYPWRLYHEGLAERPAVFAANRLVLAVPIGSELASMAGLAKPGVKLVIGDSTVPVGEYTREVLGRLPGPERRAILANVRSEEPEVSSVLAKLVGGAADAGFIYVSDLKTAPPHSLRAISIPRDLQPDVAYAATVLDDALHPGLAHRYLDGLLGGHGQADLRRAGFLPPP
jgi:molybdate transport system substrate-binding protein